jgi:hypothetical protein
LFTIELGHMFDGALVHSGANDQVRWLISQSGLTDLDEYFHPDPYYYIEPEGKWKDYPWMGRVVTGAKRLRDYLTKTGKEKAVHLDGFTFSGEGDPVPQGEPATYFLVPYPKRALVEYRYDAEKHVYERWVQGVVIEAKWVRPATEDFVKYVYLDGTPVPLRPGQTWVEVVPLEYQITVGE